MKWERSHISPEMGKWVLLGTGLGVRMQRVEIRAKLPPPPSAKRACEALTPRT